MFETCLRPGMPAIEEVKKWLFNREYHQEYEGFRESYLKLQERSSIIHFEELRYLLEQYTDLTKEPISKENNP